MPSCSDIGLMGRWSCQWARPRCQDGSRSQNQDGLFSSKIRHCCLASCKSVTNYGQLTEPISYYVEIVRTQISTSNGHISETKKGTGDPLAPKFSSFRGLSSPLSWKWPSVTLSLSFGLFQSENPLFQGVPDVTHCHSLVRICSQVPFPRRKKKIYSAPHTFACRVKFVTSFVAALTH